MLDAQVMKRRTHYSREGMQTNDPRNEHDAAMPFEKIEFAPKALNAAKRVIAQSDE